MIGSPEVNKIIRRDLSPLLKQQGFAQVQVRHNWGWHGSCTWVLDIRSVGSYFASVTGWPAQSLSVSLGVFYDFVPLGLPRIAKHTPDGKPLPADVDCHQRSVLNCGFDQHHYTKQLENPGERSRNDLWWIEPDGNNVSNAVQDIARQFLAGGLIWFDRMTDLSTAYSTVLTQHDCLNKFSLATYLAKYLQREAEYQDHRTKLENEALRIGGTALLAMYS